MISSATYTALESRCRSIQLLWFPLGNGVGVEEAGERRFDRNLPDVGPKRTAIEQKRVGGMKGYKVTDSSRERMWGVACDSLSQLREKGVLRLGIREDVYLALDDGTIIDDEEYFHMIPSQTVIIFYRKTEPLVTGADYMVKLLKMINAGYLTAGEKASRFLAEKAQDLVNLLRTEKKPTKASSERRDDPDWFADLETNATTKEEYMSRKSQDRIKGYFYKFQTDVRRSCVYVEDAKARAALGDCIRHFREKLKSDEYFGCFFDRRFSRRDSIEEVDAPRPKKRKKRRGEEEMTEAITPTYDRVSYCDGGGRFACQGKWDSEECKFAFRHVINPYVDRESRILFSTWNLDHRIEKSRTILPTLLEAVKNRGREKCVNYDYFYQLLFTNFNLKLVHVVCHDKATHNIACNSKLVYKG